MNAPSPLAMEAEEAAFQAAARALQQRLVTATRAEMDFNKVDLQNIYRACVLLACITLPAGVWPA